MIKTALSYDGRDDQRIRLISNWVLMKHNFMSTTQYYLDKTDNFVWKAELPTINFTPKNPALFYKPDINTIHKLLKLNNFKPNYNQPLEYT
jgi:hypothetical protein